MISTVLRVSKSPVGSSSKRISGSFASARAMVLGNGPTPRTHSRCTQDSGERAQASGARIARRRGRLRTRAVVRRPTARTAAVRGGRPRPGSAAPVQSATTGESSSCGSWRAQTYQMFHAVAQADDCQAGPRGTWGHAHGRRGRSSGLANAGGARPGGAIERTLQQFDGAALPFGRGQSTQDGHGQLDVLVRREVGEQVERLKHEACRGLSGAFARRARYGRAH